ncbi:MAG: hypothetical protein HY770_03695 [Chitinivibrionia bacterium]|nr:hypothetical protein [Chitinivibrionia bacterium]
MKMFFSYGRAIMRTATCLAVILLAGGCATAREPPRFSVDDYDPEVTPANGVRHWKTPFTPLGVTGCYVSPIKTRDGRMELWSCVDRRTGPSLEKLGRADTMAERELLTDVSDAKDPATLAENRAFQRGDMRYDEHEGYILFGCVCPDYLPGSVSLAPAILVSKTGEKGTWRYLGKLKGDPADECAKRKVWSDAGSIFRLADGRWRIYLNGFGPVLAAMECDTLDGEWRFLRDDTGGIREMLPCFPKDKEHGGCLPQLLRIDDTDWHCWITDKWPPQSIFHFQSADGLAWKPFGEQPELTRAAFNSVPIKCFRGYYDPVTKQIIGIISVWGKVPYRDMGVWSAAKARLGFLEDDEWWNLYMTTMERNSIGQ